MKNPRSPIKIVLSTAFSLILAGSLGFLFSDNFHGIASASDDRTQAFFISETAASEKQVIDLAQTSPAWRRTLTKHIFANIEKELQSLEQQLIRHNSAKGKRFVKRVRVALQKMQSGKQKFVRTGLESSLDSFYNGRTVLEYNLWKLKNLTRNLEMDTVQSRGLYRVYALTNKWLVYVAHREINARRQGTLGASPQAEAVPTGEQKTEAATTAFQQISEVAKITEQDIKEANKALSKQPAVLKTTEPSVKPVTLKSLPLKAETTQEAKPNLGMEEDNLFFSQSSGKEQTAEPATLESLELGTSQKPEPDLMTEGGSIDSSEASSIPNWMFLLGMAGMILVAFLIFRSKRKPSYLSAFYRGNPESQLEHDGQNTDELIEIHTLIESRPTEDTQVDSASDFSLENSIFREAPYQSPGYMALQNEQSFLDSDISETTSSSIEDGSTDSEEESATGNEALEGITSHLTDNGFEDEVQEDITFKLEGLTQKLESTLAEKKELAQGMKNILAENESLAETLRISHEEKTKLTQKLEALHADREESTQGLENILAENDSLTEKVETFHEAKEDLEKQLKSLNAREEELARELKILRTEKEENARELETFHAEKEEFAQGLENILAENDSLTERLEISNEAKVNLEKQLESFHAEKEMFAQELENTLAEKNSLTEKLETSREEKASLETELEALCSREEVLAQGLENTLAEKNSLTQNLDTSRTEKEYRDKQLETLHAEKGELAQELENTLAENNSLTEKLETSREEKKSLETQLEALHSREGYLAQELENTLAAQEQNNTDATFEALAETLESTREKNKILTKELKSTSTEKEALIKKLKAAQEKNKKITKQNKTLANKLEVMQTKNNQATEPQHNLTHELETMSVDVEDLKEKLESTYFENETLAGDASKENQDIPPDSLPSDQETSHPDVILLQTILKAAKGIRNINERLYKIAETRLAPSIKDSPGNSKEKDSRKS